jgi:hypothetical protein
VWDQVKLDVGRKNKTFKISDVERLVNEELDKVTQVGWASYVHCAVKLQDDDDYSKELGCDKIL